MRCLSQSILNAILVVGAGISGVFFYGLLHAAFTGQFFKGLKYPVEGPEPCSMVEILPPRPVSGSPACVGDTIKVYLQGSNVSSNAYLELYMGDHSNFDPLSGEGSYAGICKLSYSCNDCPSLVGIMIDPCKGNTVEQDNEFLVLSSGCGFLVDELVIDLDTSNNNLGLVNSDIGVGNNCQFVLPSNDLMSSLLSSSGCPGEGIHAAGPGDSIPAAALVFVFTDASASAPGLDYNLGAYCESGLDIYVLQNGCDRSMGAFTNGGFSSGTRTYGFHTAQCADSVVYSNAVPVANGSNGGYVFLSAGEDGILPYVSPDCTDLPFPAEPVPAIMTIADTLEIILQPEICNGSGIEEKYLRAVLKSNGACDGFLSEPGPLSSFRVSCVPKPVIEDDLKLCSADPVTPLAAFPAGGLWTGPGILDTQQGLFDPSVGPGLFEVVYAYELEGCVALDTGYFQVSELAFTCQAVSVDSGNSNGSLLVSIIQGLPVFSVSWSGPVSGEVSLEEEQDFEISQLPEGLYSISITDAGGCTQDCSLEIESLGCTLGIDTVYITDASCPGMSNGSIQVLPANGIPPYTYAVNDSEAQSQNLFTGLQEGSYQIIVTDLAGCTDSMHVFLGSAPGPELVILSISDASCGIQNGFVTVAGNGGTMPYLFSIDGKNYGHSATFGGLGEGVKQIHLLDASGCRDSLSIQIDAADGPWIEQLIGVNPSCGTQDGSITVIADGGSGGLSYGLNGGNWQQENSFYGLGPGVYTITVEDQNGCPASSGIELYNESGPEIDEVFVSPTICGGATGVIQVVVSGGNGPFQYQLDNGDFQLSGRFLDLEANEYTITVMDASGCVSSVTVKVHSVDGPGFDTLTVTPTSCGYRNGVIEFRASGGAGPFTFYLDGNGPLGSPITSLGPGVYELMVRDANGCQAIQHVEISPSDSLEMAVQPGLASCGNQDGMISIGVSGGTGPYQYSVGGPFENNFFFDGLAPGKYTVSVLDANNCMLSQEVEVGMHNIEPVTGIDVQHPDCTNPFGQLTIHHPEGGLVQYALDCSSFQENPAFTGLSPGIYNVCVRDDFGCIATTQVVLEEVIGIGIDTILITIMDCASNTAALTIIPEGGIPPFQYDIKDDQFLPQLSNTFESIPSGRYLIEVTDAQGCTGMDSVVIHEMSIEETQINAEICRGGSYELNGNVYDSTGHFEITFPGDSNKRCDSIVHLFLSVIDPPIASAGPDREISCAMPQVTLDGSGTLADSFVWLGPGIDRALINLDHIVVSQPGVYLLHAYNSAQCQTSDTVIVAENRVLPPVEAGPDGMLDCIEDTIEIGDFAMDSVAHILLKWETFDGKIVSDPSSAWVAVVSAGIYVLEAKDTTNGCIKSDTVFIHENLDLPVAMAGDSVFLGCTDQKGTISALGSTEGDSIRIKWSGPGISMQESGYWQIEVEQAGVYILEVTNLENGCADYDSVIVAFNEDVPGLAILEISDPSCFGTEDGILKIHAVYGGKGGFQFSMDDGPPTQDSLFTGLAPGMHTLRVLDANGCALDSSFILDEPLPVEILLSPVIELESVDSFSLNPAFNFPIEEIASIIWSPTDQLSCSNCISPVFIGDRDDTISLTVVTRAGCIGQASLIIIFTEGGGIFIPNVCTPNGDQVNDWFTLYGSDQVRRILKMEIFGKWGGKVFERTDFRHGIEELGWNGTLNGQPLDPGVFAYRIEVEFDDGRTKVFFGDVTVLK